MAKTKTERIAEIQTQIAQLEKRQKELEQAQKVQERKDRTKRLCKRAGLLESLLPDTIPLTDEHFKAFLEKTMLTDFARRILADYQKLNTANAAPEAADTVQSGGKAGGADEGNGARHGLTP
ncbi:MAG: DUF3847 domain-containing protein [Azoarcus sp.]|nr:DUF3847 domain-containing protein [Azoarcus sp.]